MASISISLLEGWVGSFLVFTENTHSRSWSNSDQIVEAPLWLCFLEYLMQKVVHSGLPVMQQCQFRLYYCMASSYGSFSLWFSTLVSSEVKWKLFSRVWLFVTPRILQARILEWVAFPFSRESSQPRDQTLVSYIAGGFFTSWATRESLVSCNSLYLLVNICSVRARAFSSIPAPSPPFRDLSFAFTGCSSFWLLLGWSGSF